MNRPRMDMFSSSASKTNRVLAAIDGRSDREFASPNQEINIDLIDLPPSQPRQYFDGDKMVQLVASVKERGILEPLLVRPKAGGRYELVAGERRYRAARELALSSVPVAIRELTDTEALEVALVENLQREDLNPIEEVEGVLQLLSIRFSLAPAEISRVIYSATNKTTSNVTSSPSSTDLTSEIQDCLTQLGINLISFATNRLPLLKLPEDVLVALRQGKIEYTKARAIAKVKEPAQRQALLEKAISENLSLTQIKENMAQSALKPRQAKTNPTFNRRIQKIEKIILNKGLLDDPKTQREIDKLLKTLEELIGN